MRAWIEKGVTGLGAGLGKMDVLVVPRQNGNSLVVNLATDGSVWIEDQEREGQPSLDDPLKEIEISEKLAGEVDFSFDIKTGSLTEHTKKLLRKFVSSAA